MAREKKSKKGRYVGKAKHNVPQGFEKVKGYKGYLDYIERYNKRVDFMISQIGKDKTQSRGYKKLFTPQQAKNMIASGSFDSEYHKVFSFDSKDPYDEDTYKYRRAQKVKELQREVAEGKRKNIGNVNIALISDVGYFKKGTRDWLLTVLKHGEINKLHEEATQDQIDKYLELQASIKEKIYKEGLFKVKARFTVGALTEEEWEFVRLNYHELKKKGLSSKAAEDKIGQDFFGSD